MATMSHCVICMEAVRFIRSAHRAKCFGADKMTQILGILRLSLGQKTFAEVETTRGKSIKSLLVAIARLVRRP